MYTIVCGWCNRVMRKGFPDLVTRLICSECFEREMRIRDERIAQGIKPAEDDPAAKPPRPPRYESPDS